MSVSELVPSDISNVQPRPVKVCGKCSSMRLVQHLRTAPAKEEEERERRAAA